MDFGVTIGTRLLPALAALLFAVAGPVAAQGDAAAGRFIAVTGEVKVIGSDGVTRVAVRNGEIRQGDSIVTGINSLAQLRMSDGGALSVRADTQLKLDAYRFTKSEDRDSNFAVSILKGGFRALTGLIARHNRQNYRVSTSAMTIGVRGTHFEVVHVLQPVADAVAGTYNRVYDGTISVQNRAGASLLVSPGQTVFVALPSNLPPVLVAPPVGVFGRPTPAPQVTPQSGRDDGKAEAKRSAPAVTREAPAVRGTSPVQTVAPARMQSAPLLNPIDTPTTISPALVSPTLISPTLISPTTISPTTTTISPTTTTISPTTTTISPVLTAPTTTTISPILTAPTTTTISPVLTAPTTTTISPILTAPTTTTISPVLTAPTTTIQTAPTTSTIIKR